MYNIPDFKGDIAEIFCGTWDLTVNKVNSSKTINAVLKSEIYTLSPKLDKRLKLKTLENPTKEQIQEIYQDVLSKGFEGIVLKQDEEYLKVKPEETIDTPIIDWYEGKGKYSGMLGGFITKEGRVGSGLTDEQRKVFWGMKEQLIGENIEVSCMQFTKTGKFRHPRFKRLRFDK